MTLASIGVGVVSACSGDSTDGDNASDDSVTGATGGSGASGGGGSGGKGGGSGRGGASTSGGSQGIGGEGGEGGPGEAGEGGRGEAGAGGEAGVGTSGAGGAGCSCVHGTCAGASCVCDTGWVGASCNARPLSCRALASQFPSAGTDAYVIDPDGSGSIAPLSAYCDMTFDGGGWTLVMASNALGPVAQSPGNVAPLSGTYMPVETLQALAASGVSSQIHIRSAGQATVASITSTPNSLPITNLRTGQILNANSGIYSSTAVVTDWTGPYATAYHLWHSCGAPPFDNVTGSYPNVWWSCNNGNGLHIASVNSGWNADTAQNQAMEVYLR